METSQAVILPPLQSPLRSRPEESDCLLPGVRALAYQPIDSENGEIRLVKLLPGRYDDIIRMDLYTENLNDTPSYEALSYAWGTTPSSNRAIINGCPVPVRDSLDLGLRRLRLTDEPRTLWVDALCINQNDVRERSHQVQQMGMIYKSAEQVVVWLGEWPDLDTCQDFRDCQGMFVERLNEWSALRSEHYFDQNPKSQFSRHLCQHAFGISRLPWFRRLWILQEFLLAAHRPMMMLGECINISNSFIYVIKRSLRILFDHPSTSASEREQADESLTHFTMLQEMEFSFLEYGGTSLYTYSVLSRFSNATDPRDRIYGLLGMIKPYVAEPIIPDYSKTWPQILAEATIVMISEDGLAPYISGNFAFPSANGPKECYRTPSWVLDFSRPSSGRTSFDFIGYDLRRPGSEVIENRRKSLRLSDDLRTLYKYGCYVGTIRKIFVFKTDTTPEDRWQETPAWAAGLHDFYHQVLKPRGIAPSRLYEAIHSMLYTYYNLERFVSSLRGHRDQFMRVYPRYGDEDNFAVFTTEEGDVGATWLSNTFEIRADDIIVALFERQMPFVLRPVPGDSTYRMVNLAYITECSGGYTKGFFRTVYNHRWYSELPVFPHDWVYDASEGCSEYAIV